MREQVSREIDGHVYTCTQLGFSDARGVLTLLTKKVMPGLALGLAGAVSGLQKDGAKGLGDLDFGEVAEGVLRLVKDLDEADLVALEERFGKTCTVQVDGRAPVLTKENLGPHFQGKLLSYFKWLAFCVEVNYADFFALARGLQGPVSSTSTS